MYGQQYIEFTDREAALLLLYEAVERCRQSVDRPLLVGMLRAYAHRAEKGPATGDTDHFGEAVNADDARQWMD